MSAHTDDTVSNWALTRRSFLLGTGALLVGCSLGENGAKTSLSDDPSDTRLNAWIRITDDNKITIIVSQLEMGQGIMTTLPSVIADELGADWSSVNLEYAPIAAEYRQPEWQWQVTAGATSTRTFYEVMRKAAAAAREMLHRAAADKLDVDANNISINNSELIDESSGRKLTFGDVAVAASKLSIPQEPRLKSRNELQLLGTSVPRIDTPAKVNGSAIFGIDVGLENMLHAAIKQAPVFGARLLEVNTQTLTTTPGIIKVVKLEDAVAVVAESWWQAKRALDQLQPQWSPVETPVSSTDMLSRYRKSLDNDELIAMPPVGDMTTAPDDWQFEAEYVSPFQAHATLEPQNCTAQVNEDGCEVWAPLQNPESSQLMIAETLGIAREKVKINPTYIGGGFGRRLMSDYIVQAVLIARELTQPVKLLWTREEDTQHDFYRPLTVNRLAATFNDTGVPVAIRHKVATSKWIEPAYPKLIHHHLQGLLAGAFTLPFDPMAVEGLDHLPYHSVSFFNQVAMQEIPVPTAVWRSTAYGTNIFAVESFIDELAARGQVDPLAYRRSLMGEEREQLAVLDAAAEAVAWSDQNTQRPMGFAYAHAFGSYVAQIVELSVGDVGVSIERIVTAVDCGRVINPDIVRQQMEGGVIWALNGALRGPINISEGAVAQSNFHDYPLLGMRDIPKMEVILVDSDRPPAGVGEAGAVALPAALGNALFAATGRRQRQLPFSLSA